MASLLVRRFPKFSSEIQSIQRRLVSSCSNGPGYVPTVPPHYFIKNPVEISNMPAPSDDSAGARWWHAQRKEQRVFKKEYLQVYSIQILSDELDQIYGTIVLDYHKSLFHREFGQDNNRHDIDAHGFVRLRGLKCPISVRDDYVDVVLKLYRGNHPGDFFHPARGIKCMDRIPYEDVPILDRLSRTGVNISIPTGFNGYPADRLLSKEIKTTCGTVRVVYATFSDAAQYYLTIKLLEWKGKGDCANIFGRIYASNTMIDDERAKSLVFDKNRDGKTLSIMSGYYIPLQIPDNIASMGHSLELTLSIFHKNMGSSDDQDDLELLRETFSVEAKCYAEVDTSVDGFYDRFQFNGKFATFEVLVYWVPVWSWPDEHEE